MSDHLSQEEIERRMADPAFTLTVREFADCYLRPAIRTMVRKEKRQERAERRMLLRGRAAWDAQRILLRGPYG